MKRLLMLMTVLIFLSCRLNADETMGNPVNKSSVLKAPWESVFKSSVVSVEGAQNLSEENLLDKKITFHAHETMLQELVRLIAQEMNLNPVLSSSIQDRAINLSVTDMPIKSVLNSLLFPLGYGFSIKNGSLVILDKQTRIFKVLLPPISQDFEDLTSNESFNGSKDDKNQPVRVGSTVVVRNRSKGLSFWDDVALNINALMTKEGKFAINKTAGTVLVTDAPNVLEQVGAYFEDLNKRITQQIEVDVKVVEVSLSKDNKMGVNWAVLAKNLKLLNSASFGTNFALENFASGSGMTINAKGKADDAGVSDGGIKMVIDALAKEGKVNVVSQPRIVVLNNQVSVIQVGSTQSYIDHSSIESTQNGATIAAVTTAQVQDGITMRLLGNIVGEEIYLSVTPIVTTIDNIRQIRSGQSTIEAPQTTTKSINTLVKLKNGATVAIGGLITTQQRNSVDGVPLLSRMPVLGKLFSYSHDKSERNELVIFITPRKI